MSSDLFKPTFMIAALVGGLALVVGAMAVFPAPSIAAGQITEIIDGTGDGMGNPLDVPSGIAVGGNGNVYVTGDGSDNAFKITPGGVITEIIDGTGDGMGNTLNGPSGIAVDGNDNDNVYVTGDLSDNAFKITPSPAVGGIAELPDVTDSSGRNYVTLAGLAVAAAAALSAGAWYARRRWVG